MNFATQKDELLAHYVAMARLPGAKDYAWHRVKELAASSPQFYGDMPARLTAEMKKQA